MFLDPTSAIANGISQHSEISATAVNEFLVANGIPLSAEKADRFAALLLAASCLEYNAAQDPAINTNLVS
ncbi:hypothetical protein [Arsenophonus endosymbiont of Aleurodicus floccissimus]|uniref:hypothetical protein n=1 Tax=Arsenophonus endosymbiont of Aleurodicus floccissimus TaxID=2152761 RepID=UPI000E6B3CB5|nr:hypothetical protein [Arsenophonus endosymbiont of Aleurodicus floccissimus]